MPAPDPVSVEKRAVVSYRTAGEKPRAWANRINNDYPYLSIDGKALGWRF
jgi:hypothetical protein